MMIDVELKQKPPPPQGISLILIVVHSLVFVIHAIYQLNIVKKKD